MNHQTASPQASAWLGLDIGGANIKAAHSTGGARTLPFELWKRPDDLADTLAGLLQSLPEAQRLAVTMTAELCDCYPTRRTGVRRVLDAVKQAAPTAILRIWGTDGAFHTPAAIDDQPELAAAANWLALATLAARLLPEGPGLLIDIGTTTTDLIPLKDGLPVPQGRTDSERLRTGELVYAGVVRTPICALATTLPWRGAQTGLAAELFASTLDAYLILGEIPEDPANLSTADGRPRTRAAARDRLARMVCGDRDDFSEDDTRALAEAAHLALLSRLEAAARQAMGQSPPSGAVLAGSGGFLARHLARALVPPGGAILALDDVWGPSNSSAGCAYAVAALAAERLGACP